MPGNNLKLADEFASDYDNSILKNNWNGPGVIFSLANKHLKPKSKILDIGVGTGESAIRFQSAGHIITGLDGSENMILECKKKNICSELIVHNIEKTPFPIGNKVFDVIISNGVFHLIHPLKQVFQEAKRLLKSGGTFLFTFEDAGETKDYIELENGIWECKTETGVYTYKHSYNYILGILQTLDFTILEKKRFLGFENNHTNKKYYFTVILARLKQNR